MLEGPYQEIPLPVGCIRVLEGINVTGIVTCRFEQNLRIPESIGDRSLKLYLFSKEVEIEKVNYYVFILGGEPDIIHFGRAIEYGYMCIDGRVEYNGNWSVYMYHRVVIGETQEDFDQMCELYRQKVLKELLRFVGLNVIPLVEVKEQS
jgi:hypothetical protein